MLLGKNSTVNEMLIYIYDSFNNLGAETSTTRMHTLWTKICCVICTLMQSLCSYQSSNTEEGSTVADHSPCTRGLSLRLTNDGYLTGDLQMDLPPLKTVLIDPYTG